jgi:hypothetical protein
MRGNGTNGANGSNGHGTNGGSAAIEMLPPTYDQAKVDKALKLISEGQSVRNACLDCGLVRPTFILWVLKNVAGLSDQYARAREAQMEALEDEILAIADDSQKDTTTRRDAQGNEYEVPDHEWIARSKLRVDARRWLMSKIAPKKYGDRSETLVSGDPSRPIRIRIDPFKNHREVIAERAPIELANSDPASEADA